MAKAPTKTPYIRGSNGTKPTPKVIPPKPIDFQITQNTGLFPAGGAKTGKK
jgi:hypothetical protein